MKFIIAPAKKMTVNPDDFNIQGMPVFIDKAQQILTKLKQLSYDDAKKLWHTSDKLTQTNYDILQRTDLTDRKVLTPALISYTGIQYQYMAPSVFTHEQLEYVQNNLRILSGFYGILRPFDGIVPYRLEMQSKLEVAGTSSIYDFWGDNIYSELTSGSAGPIINLASKEYASAITPFLTDNDTMISIDFKQRDGDKLKTKATFAKMARGEMVRYAAEHNITSPDQLIKFDRLDFHFDETLSSNTNLVFIKE
ncbi:peroxide stress protein YaaA [Lentilactobacillus sp. Marseille-Q4993]|uniref:peroxide stress protein YaaA n=1 Tax=Lentilactobacillus sp. Marseille-Q4993 TaxID=3039492 RepID=UPI0024BCFDC0|nr:peroxide stress protein YaaA [Lentilactobacillus sp. Marseille-Q4993]